MNIEFNKGTYRAALVVGPLTFKFIYLRRSCLKCIFKSWEYCRFLIIRGMFANITEFFVWKTLKVPFLAPTYFSLFGILNIQKTIKGEKVDCIEHIRNILKNLPEDKRGTWNLVEAHSLWTNSGWRKTIKGYVLFDYGDCFINGWPFSNILARDKKELQEILSKQEL